jgi:phosphatidate cytidylyltransferase
MALGGFYAAAMLIGPVILRRDPGHGLAAIVLLFAVVWATDILAYFAGRTLGGPKLAPTISPKKTWSGALGGAVAAVAAAVVFGIVTDLGNPAALGVIGLLLSAIAQLGDLFESHVKRRFGAKDAGHIIPGHGGVMDRLDGFVLAALAGVLIGLLRADFDHTGRGLMEW